MNAMINEVFFISTSLIEFQRPAGTLFVLPVKLRFYCFLDKKIYLKKGWLSSSHRICTKPSKLVNTVSFAVDPRSLMVQSSSYRARSQLALQKRQPLE